MSKISKEELIEISTTIAEVLAKRLSEKDEKVERKKPVKKKPREEYVRVQVENRKPLTPTYKIKTPADLKQEKLDEKLEKERKLKEERDSVLVKCSICGEYFHPTSKINTVCSNKICKQINVYNNIIKKHTKLRQEELELLTDKQVSQQSEYYFEIKNINNDENFTDDKLNHNLHK